MSQKVRDGGRKVDAVDEDVNIEDLLEGSTLGCFFQIPLENVVPRSIQSQQQLIYIEKEHTHRARSFEKGRQHRGRTFQEHQ